MERTPMDRMSPKNYAYDRSLSLCISAWSIYVGLAVALTSAVPSIVLTNTITVGIPVSLALMVALFLVVGNIQMIRGITASHETMREGWQRERNGMVVAISGWLSYGTVVIVTRPQSTIIPTLSLVLTLAYILRMVDLRRRTKAQIAYLHSQEKPCL